MVIMEKICKMWDDRRMQSVGSSASSQALNMGSHGNRNLGWLGGWSGQASERRS